VGDALDLEDDGLTRRGLSFKALALLELRVLGELASRDVLPRLHGAESVARGQHPLALAARLQAFQHPLEAGQHGAGALDVFDRALLDDVAVFDLEQGLQANASAFFDLHGTNRRWTPPATQALSRGPLLSPPSLDAIILQGQDRGQSESAARGEP